MLYLPIGISRPTLRICKILAPRFFEFPDFTLFCLDSKLRTPDRWTFWLDSALKWYYEMSSDIRSVPEQKYRGCVKPCPHCRRKVRLLHKSETVWLLWDSLTFVSQKWDWDKSETVLSQKSETVSLLWNSSLTFLRQCGQAIRWLTEQSAEWSSRIMLRICWQHSENVGRSFGSGVQHFRIRSYLQVQNNWRTLRIVEMQWSTEPLCQNPLYTFPRNFPVDSEAANLLQTC